MTNCNYLSAGIDVGSAFSWMSMVDQNGTVIQKPFKITHNNSDSLEKAVSALKKAEELHSMKCRIFLESTGIYHFPLFCFLVDSGFDVSIINPIITHSAKNASIRMERIRQLVAFNKKEKFVQQISWLNSIKGVGFLSAVTIMCEIGDFSAFKRPKQLFAFFGLDPEVNQSGNFNGTDVHMSKRGSRIARRAIFAVALASIRRKRDGEAINPHLCDYYTKKSAQKPKMITNLFYNWNLPAQFFYHSNQMPLRSVIHWLCRFL